MINNENRRQSSKALSESAARRTYRNYISYMWHNANNVSNRGNETATHVLRAINFYGSHMLTHMYIADDHHTYIAHSRPKTKHSYLPSRGLCGCIFFPFFNCYSPRRRDIMPSPACVQCDISRMEAVALFLFLSFSRITTIGERERWRAFYAISYEPFERFIPQLNNIRVRIDERAGYLSGHI